MKKLFTYTIMCFLYITLTATTCDDIDYRTVCIRNNTSDTILLGTVFLLFQGPKKIRERAAARTNCTEKNFARNEKFFYLKEKTTANMGQKRGESLLSSGSLLFTIQIYNIFRQKANRINI